MAPGKDFVQRDAFDHFVMRSTELTVEEAGSRLLLATRGTDLFGAFDGGDAVFALRGAGGLDGTLQHGERPQPTTPPQN